MEEDNDNFNNNEDPLGPLPTFSAASPKNAVDTDGGHMKTYTAGEDQGRLAEAAKALGLEAQDARRPRKQVRNTLAQRRRQHHKYLPAPIEHFIFDTDMEDARMRAIYSHHEREESGERGGGGPEDGEYSSYYYTSLPDLPPDEEGSTEGGDDEEREQQAAEGGGQQDVDPHAAGLGGDLTSAVLGIIKGMVGPAILYLPHGFASAGYVVALPIMLACTAMFLYSSQCLLDAWWGEHERMLLLQRQQEEEDEANNAEEMTGLLQNQKKKKRKKKKQRPIMLSYPELAYRATGPVGEKAVKLGIALMQSGVCLTYLIFVPQNLRSSVRQLFRGVDISAEALLLVMVAVQIPLSWIRDIRKLTPTNFLANCFILYGLLICLGFAIQHAATTTSTTTTATTSSSGAVVAGGGSGGAGGGGGSGPITNILDHLSQLNPVAKDWFLFIGTSVLLFEGSITLLVPLQEAVHSEEQRKEFPSVYRRVILGIITFYAFFGITCWMSFGDTVRTVFTTSLPPTVLATTVQLAYSIAVMFTFPLQNFPALEIACRTIAKALIPPQPPASSSQELTLSPSLTLSRSRLQQQQPSSELTGSMTSLSSNHPSVPFWLRRNFISSVLVALLAVVAVCTMNSLDKVVSLMGSLLGCPIAFCFPPLIHTHLASKHAPPRTLTARRKWLNYAVIALGGAAMIVASITTLITW